jgi:glutamyl-Q tRNA(Asp) synthetase
LHLGHAYSALFAFDMAQAQGGRFLLRIEDTDLSRARPHWETLIYQDLEWLDLTWDSPVLRQSEHLARYDEVLNVLADHGLLYPCGCKRGDIRAALSAPQEGGPAVQVYPGTCRHRPMTDRDPGDALRLNMERALEIVKSDLLKFTETGGDAGIHQIDPGWMQNHVGDAVLGRKDIAAVSYVLAAVVDDAVQGISTVVRGADLFETTHLQVLLQALLSLPTPIYHHHRLVRDDQGKRLAKRDDARAISKYREDGYSPQDIRALVGL